MSPSASRTVVSLFSSIAVSSFCTTTCVAALFGAVAGA
jgi:hypothetical protein